MKTDLQATLKKIRGLLARAHAIADPILARWKAEESARTGAKP